MKNKRDLPLDIVKLELEIAQAEEQKRKDALDDAALIKLLERLAQMKNALTYESAWKEKWHTLQTRLNKLRGVSFSQDAPRDLCEKRAWALEILGLSESASKEEIKKQ